METRCNRLLWVATLSWLAWSSARPAWSGLDLPWRQAGLTERQAAAHLLDRLSYGPRPGDIDRLLDLGLERWLQDQLAGSLADPALDSRLDRLTALDLGVREVAELYPNPGLVLRQAQQEGVLSEDFDFSQMDDPTKRREVRSELMDWARQKGYRPQRELIGQLATQKLLRAIYSENQLEEVLTDFWFNHFNVSLTDNQTRVYVLSYERDAIRPYVLGSFGSMLEATAKHPAMLLYLDNAQSTAAEGDTTTFDAATSKKRRSPRGGATRASARPRQRSQGLNENYARELLELHTLGVDGGYSQDDVVEVARAFTGWTIYPPSSLRAGMSARIDRALNAGVGFVAEDGFLFRADAHDAEKKRILGRSFPAGRGVEEGEKVLDMVASHPSTSKHIAKKLAVRFVSDDPPQDLIDRLAETFEETDGDLARTMETLVESAEFWSAEVRRQKIKSPFELTVSALRALDAEVTRPRATIEWIGKMGQPLYAYQAPTGYPDEAEFWVNTGALLNRMNFGLALAAGQVPGVEFDLLELNQQREPESRLDALESYVPLLLPERDPTETIALLEPMVQEPELRDRVEQAAPPEAEQPAVVDEAETRLFGDESEDRSQWGRGSVGEPSALEEVVGVILGSPEFQRR